MDSAAIKQEFLTYVKSYARDHYEDGKQWDYVVEAFSDDEILAAIGNAKTQTGARRNVERKLLSGVRIGMENAACYDC